MRLSSISEILHLSYSLSALHGAHQGWNIQLQWTEMHVLMLARNVATPAREAHRMVWQRSPLLILVQLHDLMSRPHRQSLQEVPIDPAGFLIVSFIVCKISQQSIQKISLGDWGQQASGVHQEKSSTFRFARCKQHKMWQLAGGQLI